MIVVGVAFSTIAVIFSHLWGPLRIILILAGVVLVVLGFLLLRGAKGITFKALGGGGGMEASTDMPRTGYTKRITISESLVEGATPPKLGSIPSKAGTVPPKETGRDLLAPAEAPQPPFRALLGRAIRTANASTTSWQRHQR
jgi:hypothetical protein